MLVNRINYISLLTKLKKFTARKHIDVTLPQNVTASGNRSSLKSIYLYLGDEFLA